MYPTLEKGKFFLVLYMYVLLLTIQTQFKAMRVYWTKSGQYIHQEAMGRYKFCDEEQKLVIFC